MSVPKSERRQSHIEYIVIFQNLEKFCLNLNAQNKDNPQLSLFSQELAKKSIEAYNYATLFFEACYGSIPGNTAQKRKYCQQAAWALKEIASQFNILMAFRMDDNKSVKYLQIEIQEMLKAFQLLQKQLRELKS